MSYNWRKDGGESGSWILLLFSCFLCFSGFHSFSVVDRERGRIPSFFRSSSLFSCWQRFPEMGILHIKHSYWTSLFHCDVLKRMDGWGGSTHDRRTWERRKISRTIDLDLLRHAELLFLAFFYSFHKNLSSQSGFIFLCLFDILCISPDTSLKCLLLHSQDSPIFCSFQSILLGLLQLIRYHFLHTNYPVCRSGSNFSPQSAPLGFSAVTRRHYCFRSSTFSTFYKSLYI